MMNLLMKDSNLRLRIINNSLKTLNKYYNIKKNSSIIKESFDYWLPYIFINNVDVTNNPDTNRINILLTISLQDNKLDTRSILVAVENNT